MRNILSGKNSLRKRTSIAIIASLVTVLFIGCIFVQAKTPSSDEVADLGRTKRFKSIEIQKGDTLWSIAEEYMTEEYPSVYSYIEDVKEMNGFTGDTIYEGCYLVVPIYVD